MRRDTSGLTMIYGRRMDRSWISSWGWVALALINAGLAEQKNRTRLGWFLGSLLIGPVATAYIVFAHPRLRPTSSTRRLAGHPATRDTSSSASA